MITNKYNALAYDPSGNEEDVDVLIHHNGDFSGEVIILVLRNWTNPQPAVHNYTKNGKDYHIAELNVPYSALRDLVLDHLRQEMIDRLENMNNDDLWNALVEKS